VGSPFFEVQLDVLLLAMKSFPRSCCARCGRYGRPVLGPPTFWQQLCEMLRRAGVADVPGEELGQTGVARSLWGLTAGWHAQGWVSR